VGAVEVIHRRHEGLAAGQGLGWRGVKRQLRGILEAEVGREHADFAKGKAGAVDAAEQTCGDPGEVAAVVARHGQGAAGGGAILRAAAVGVGFEEDLEEAGELALGAEFFRDAADVGGEGFA
jgi:hypothetical protein